jgi:hypothetical protein
LNDAVEQMGGSMKRLAAFAVDQARQLAADVGEAPTYANRTYWGTMGNLLSFGGNLLNSGSPELYAQHELACSVLRRNADQWSAGAPPVPGIVQQHGHRQNIGVPGRRHPLL